jgi:hypothetical protein
MAKITKLTTLSIKKEMDFGDNVYDNTCILVKELLSEEIQSKREHLFIITLKNRILQGIHITNIGSINMSAIDYKSLVKYALEDDADEVIICHNHPLIVGQRPEEISLASDRDLKAFFIIFEIFTYLGIFCSCGVFGGNAEYTTFYHPNEGTNDIFKESGWVDKIATEDKTKKKYKIPIPYVKLNDKKIFYSYFKKVPKDNNHRKKMKVKLPEIKSNKRRKS